MKAIKIKGLLIICEILLILIACNLRDHQSVDQTFTPSRDTVGVDNGSIANRILPECVSIGQTWVSPIDNKNLMCVPSGEFIMGASDADQLADEDEKPQHKVYLNAFWLDQTEVTNEEYARCMTDGICQPEIYETTALTYIPYSVHPDFKEYPALIYIADDAAAYCKWAGRRLPTEAEWEKAARGTDGRIYPWGNILDCGLANYYTCENIPVYDPNGPRCGYSSYCRTLRVDSFPGGASPYGILNMSGNVWEWVSDWYSTEYFLNSPQENPQGPDSGDFRVRKGGGAVSLAKDLRVSSRASGKGEHYFDGQMGFRCAVGSPIP
jgi:formylglycine-generating enzyme required for sulfatase activity